MKKNLVHDVACATTRHILEVIGACIREEEQQDAFDEIYLRVRAGIECYEKHSNRMERLLDPGSN
jgi:hypothetical protein